MWALDRPQHSARSAYATCISRVRNPGLAARLAAATTTVVEASAAFDLAAAQGRLHQIATSAIVAPDITTEEMGKVYAQRMVKNGSPGREIYDEIFGCSAHGRCPLCGQRPVATIDHHLPKAHYPALAVAPLNLLPACSDCNKAKLDAIPATAEEVALHPYYDDLGDDVWLIARVVERRPAALRFQVRSPAVWGPVLTARVLHHFRSLHLAALYASEAAEELINIRHQLVMLATSGAAGAVRGELERRAESCAIGRQNGWRSAAYRAWNESDWFCGGGFEGA